MQKTAMFINVGNVVFPDYTTQPRVVVSVTKYEYTGVDYFYLEMQELFGTDIIRRGIPGNNNISCLDPDESARLYSLHKNGNPQPDPSKVVLTDHEKMVTTAQSLLKGDIVTDNQNVIHAEVLKVETTTVLGEVLVTCKRYRDDKITYDRRPMRAHFTIYRKKDESVTEGRRFLTINVHDIRVGDVVADVDETPAGEVTEVVRGSQYLGHIFRYRSYADNEIHQEHRPKGSEINVYREIRR